VPRARVGRVVRSKLIDPEDRKRDLQEKMRVLEEKFPNLKTDKFLWNICALEEIRKEVTSDPRVKKGVNIDWETLERTYDTDFGWPYGMSGDERIRWRRDHQRYFPGLIFQTTFGLTFLKLPGEE